MTPHNAHGALFRKQLVRSNAVPKKILRPLLEVAPEGSKELKI